MRAATAAEIAANHAIRCEFDQQSQLSSHFVDSTLVWANGLAGKMSRLLLPMTKSSNKKHAKVKELQKLAQVINEKRNAVAHQGEFCSEEEAKEIIAVAQEFITDLVTLYDAAFVLKKRKDAAD